MTRSPKYRPVALIRGILLAGLALFLGGVVAVFVSNRMNSDVQDERTAGGVLDIDLAELILSGKGFDFEVTDGDKRLYHISADRILASRDNVVTLEGIVLAVEREAGDAYRLSANTGTYHSDSRGAEVEGDVTLTGPDGVEVRGEKFVLVRKGSIVRSRGPVVFAADKKTTGSANELEAYLEKDRLQLAGNVELLRQPDGTNDGLRLEAERVIYDKEEGLIHAEGGVRLRQGRDEMTCDRIAVTLAGEGDSKKPGSRFVRARWNVNGSLTSDDPLGFERQLSFAGQEASIEYARSGGQARRAEIVGTEAQSARLESSDDTGLVRSFSSRRIEVTLARGTVREVRTDGEVILTEFLTVAPKKELARACGNSAVAKFDAKGDLARFEIGGGADLHRAGLQTSGDALIATGDDTIEVLGNPARVYTREGELSAPKLVNNTTRGKLTASGGVRAWFPPKGGFEMVKATAASDDLPLQVTSESANWIQAEGRVEFDGDVRAWQGESFLTARRLIGENGGRVRGEGGVQTTLERTARNARKGEGAPPGPVRVTAETFVYTRADGLIEYHGRAEVRESGRMMSCDDLTVFLRANSDLDRLECHGNTLIDDRIGGRKVRGTDAVYRPAESMVEVSGNPVSLEKPDGAVIRASQVLYDFETSIAQFRSGSSRSDVPQGGGA